jgi:predicted ATP-dependent serine protease
MNELNTFSIGELMEREIEVDYLIHPLVPRPSATVIGADAGTGKTWLTLRLAMDVALGRPWLGIFPTRQANVLVVDEENAIPLLKQRLEKLALGDGGLELSELPIHFAVDQGLNLSDARSVANLDAAISELGAGLVIMDSLVRVHRAKENDAGEMAVVFGTLKKLMANHEGLVFFFNHHIRKPGMGNGDAANSLRGSSEIRAFVDTQLALRKTEDGLVLSQEKARWTEPIKAISVRITNTENGGVEVKATGAAQTSESNSTDSFIIDILSDGQLTRKQLVILAEGEGIPIRTFDSRLKYLSTHNRIKKLPRVGGETPYELVKPVDAVESRNGSEVF